MGSTRLDVKDFVTKYTPHELPFVPGRTLVHVAGGVFGRDELENLIEVTIGQHYTAGRWHSALESTLARWFGVPTCLLVNSGSSANLLAIAALMSPELGANRLRRGDEVVTAACGFPTTVAPLVQLGLTPVFVDVAPPNYNVTPEAIEAAVTPRTRAVVLAHTLGFPFDVRTIHEVCKRHGLYLVEDNCDAVGALVGGKLTGTFGDVATLSFYPAHHMTTGEGGALLTSNPRIAKAAASLRDWGRDCYCMPGHDNTCGKRFSQAHGTLPPGYDHKYVYSHLGFNLKMTEMQAAIGVAQAAKLQEFIRVRRENWNFYRENLAPLGEHTFTFSANPPETRPSPFGFLLTLREDAKLRRDDVVRALESRRIQTRALFAGNILRHPAMNGVPHRVAGDLAWSDTAMQRAFWVGVYPGVTPEQREYVVRSLFDICTE
jgi:CDP-6-deoxy-D-xylo-4-hexulose-3-dehydrase